MSYTTSNEITLEPYEDVVRNPHYNTSSRQSSSPEQRRTGPWLRHIQKTHSEFQ